MFISSHHLSVYVRRIVHASEERYERFRCPMFRGFSLCASGLSPQERARIKDTVEAEGMISNFCMFCILCDVLNMLTKEEDLMG